ncbi:MAG TPA: M56 family metallopeptidase [Armatimonadota bacterium]|nr:M56 family metallopeptidase [Armatimonadota bacterium]
MIFSPQTIDLVGWTLIHFLWEGAAGALLYALVSRAFSFRTANARYVAACAALLLLVFCPVFTFGLLSRKPPAPIETTASGADRLTSVVSTPDGKADKPLFVRVPPSVERASGRSAPAVNPIPPPGGAGSPLPPVSGWQAGMQRLDNGIPWLVLAWLIGVLALSARLLGGWIELCRIRQQATRLRDHPLNAMMRDLAARLGIKRQVEIGESARVDVPAVIGWLKPLALIPLGALSGMGSQELEALIAHELAHVRRYDYLVNLAQSLVETLLFYHPAVWWISGRIRTEREACCDDIAVAAVGSPVIYARALAALAEISSPPALALTASGGSTLNRIRRVLGITERHRESPLGWFAGVLAAALLISAVLAFHRGTMTAPKPRPVVFFRETIRFRYIECRQAVPMLESELRPEPSGLDLIDGKAEAPRWASYLKRTGVWDGVPTPIPPDLSRIFPPGTQFIPHLAQNSLIAVSSSAGLKKLNQMLRPIDVRWRRLSYRVVKVVAPIQVLDSVGIHIPTHTNFGVSLSNAGEESAGVFDTMATPLLRNRTQCVSYIGGEMAGILKRLKSAKAVVVNAGGGGAPENVPIQAMGPPTEKWKLENQLYMGLVGRVNADSTITVFGRIDRNLNDPIPANDANAEQPVYISIPGVRISSGGAIAVAISPVGPADFLPNHPSADHPTNKIEEHPEGQSYLVYVISSSLLDDHRQGPSGGPDAVRSAMEMRLPSGRPAAQATSKPPAHRSTSPPRRDRDRVKVRRLSPMTASPAVPVLSASSTLGRPPSVKFASRPSDPRAGPPLAPPLAAHGKRSIRSSGAAKG